MLISYQNNELHHAITNIAHLAVLTTPTYE